MKQTIKTSRAAGQLEKMFRALNAHFYAGTLPEPIITLKKTPGAFHNFTFFIAMNPQVYRFAASATKCRFCG